MYHESFDLDRESLIPIGTLEQVHKSFDSDQSTYLIQISTSECFFKIYIKTKE